MHLTDMLRPDSLPSKGEAAKTLADPEGDALSEEASSLTPKFDEVIAQTATQAKSTRDTPVIVVNPDAQNAKSDAKMRGSDDLNHSSITQARYSETFATPDPDLEGQAIKSAPDSKGAEAVLVIDDAGGEQRREPDQKVVPTELKSLSGTNSDQRLQTMPSETLRQPAPRSEASLTLNRSAPLEGADRSGPDSQQNGTDQKGSKNGSIAVPKDDLVTAPKPEAIVQNLKPKTVSPTSTGEQPKQSEALSKTHHSGTSMLSTDEPVTTQRADSSKAPQNQQALVLSAPQTKLGLQRGLAKSDAKLASREGHIEVQLPSGNGTTRAIPELNSALSQIQTPANRPTASDSRPRSVHQAVASSASTESFAPQSQGQTSIVTKVNPSLPIAQGLPPTGNEIARQIVAASNARRDGGVVEVLLDPPELGRIEIMIELGEQGLRATLTAERHSTADLIRRHMDLLGQEFSDAGFDLENLNFADDRTEGNERGDTPLVETASEQTPAEGSSRAANLGNIVGTDRIDIRL